MSFRRLQLGGDIYAKVDPADYDRLSDRHWALLHVEGWVYAVHRWRDGIGGPVRVTYLHREVLNAPRGAMVRFRSPNTLDCRKSNLRIPEPSNRI